MGNNEQELMTVDIEITKAAYDWFSRIAENNEKSLGEWIMERVVHVLNRGRYKELTGKEYEELEKEVNRRLESCSDRAHPAPVYSDMIDEWHYQRLKKELSYAKEAEWFHDEIVDKCIDPLHSFIIAEEENWKMKMSEGRQVTSEKLSSK